MPVGLFGLARKTILVLGPTLARIQSVSAVKFFSAATIGTHPPQNGDLVDAKTMFR